jgi:AraC-like DNA-binding protein
MSSYVAACRRGRGLHPQAQYSAGETMGGRLTRVEDWKQLAKAAEYRPADLAVLCGVSPRQLERYFHLQFQATPRQWLRELQCRSARKLIQQGYSNIAVVAELKFASESHFCREFKKFHGVSPQTFSPSCSGTQLEDAASPIDGPTGSATANRPNPDPTQRMNPQPERPRTVRKIEMEVEAEAREWTRKRLQQRLQQEADRQGGILPPTRNDAFQPRMNG